MALKKYNYFKRNKTYLITTTDKYGIAIDLQLGVIEKIDVSAEFKNAILNNKRYDKIHPALFYVALAELINEVFNLSNILKINPTDIDKNHE